MPVHISPEVAETVALHPSLLDASFRLRPMREQFAVLAETLLAAHCAGDRRIGPQVQCWWPGARGQSLDAVLAGVFSAEDAALTIAREYGFEDQAAVEALGGLAPDPAFETALDTMLSGDEHSLASQLKDHPGLATERSRYGHRSTLLHYLGSNGVETHRQKVPMNAPALARLLISHGADIRAEARMYGGGQTPYDLASTSVHPVRAGISEELNRVLTCDEVR